MHQTLVRVLQTAHILSAKTDNAPLDQLSMPGVVAEP